MRINLDSYCLLCHLRRNVETAQALGDPDTATAFTRELMRLYLEAPEDAASPNLGPVTNALFQKYYGLDPDRFREEKAQSNRFVLERLPQIRRQIQSAADPVYAALQFSILGNYIDFSALQGKVSFDELDQLLQKAQQMHPSMDTYRRLRQELAQGKKLLYLTDNAGEICFDRVFAEELQKAHPHLQITFCVRGGPIHNDATREDAELAGIPFPVIDNGNCVGGTELSLLGPDARQAMAEADVIFAKGQGNAETLVGSGYNIYYAFLIKCDRFMLAFHQPMLTPMLLRERDIPE